MTIKIKKTGEKFGCEIYEFLICKKEKTYLYDGVSKVSTIIGNKDIVLENVKQIPFDILLMCDWGKGFYENPTEGEISVLNAQKSLIELTCLLAE